jgi:hypothetical protein
MHSTEYLTIQMLARQGWRLFCNPNRVVVPHCGKKLRWVLIGIEH